MERCCQKSLFRDKAKFCSECGKPIRHSLESKESLFFQVSSFLGRGKAESFVEDYDRYGDVALDWHGLVRV